MAHVYCLFDGASEPTRFESVGKDPRQLFYLGIMTLLACVSMPQHTRTGRESWTGASQTAHSHRGKGLELSAYVSANDASGRQFEVI